MARAAGGLEVAEVFRRHFEAWRHSHAPNREQLKVARDLVACRTAVLGGHLEVCTACGWQQPAYNSCRNRHCPKCQGLRQARWVEQRMARVLPVHHFHVVFTLPAELGELARRNRGPLFELVMKAAADALQVAARDRRFWGQPAQLGITAVLHTWTRDLRLHPHVHCIVTGGGLSPDDGRWVPAAPDFLFPVHVLGALFRGKVLAGIERLRAQGLLVDDATDRAARRRRAHLYKQSWVVYAKRPFGGAEQVYRYLGRYTHRVAISNARLVSIDDAAVVFRTRGQATATLRPADFIARFLEHVLPKGFVKIRHFGLLASVNVHTRLEQARQLLAGAGPASDGGHGGDLPPAVQNPELWTAWLLALTGIDLAICPACGGRTMIRLPLNHHDSRGPPAVLAA
jgi:predicted RNA-binding Zn-ribbon protein involved in translation (DUF1610 family)